MNDILFQTNISSKCVVNSNSTDTSEQSDDLFSVILESVNTKPTNSIQPTTQEFEDQLSVILSEYLCNQIIPVHQIQNPVESTSIPSDLHFTKTQQSLNMSSVDIPQKNLENLTYSNTLNINQSTAPSAQKHSFLADTSPPLQDQQNKTANPTTTSRTQTLQTTTNPASIDTTKNIQQNEIKNNKLSLSAPNTKSSETDLENVLVSKDAVLNSNNFVLDRNLKAFKVSNYNQQANLDKKPDSIAKPLLDKIISQSTKDGANFNIQLYPKELGKVNIKMSVTGEDIKLIITCEKHETGQALMNGFPKLGNVLEKQMGFNINIEYADSKESFFSDSNQNSNDQKQNQSAFHDNKNNNKNIDFEEYINELIQQSYFF